MKGETKEDKDIERIKEEIRKTPYHKATQAHIGRLKAKLAKLKSAKGKGKSRRKGGGSGSGFAVPKSGDATVLLVGFPSVGKSTLINKLTNVESKTGVYDFTTLEVIPGMLEYKGAKIQILDIPGLITEASKGKGHGKQVLSVIRSADLLVIMLDDVKQVSIIKRELHDAGFRLDQRPPDVRIIKHDKGGVNINIAVKTESIDKETIKSVLSEFKVHNADVLVRENITVDQLIDSFMLNRVYVPSLVILNKMDEMDASGIRKIEPAIIPISALLGKNLDVLKEAIWEKLDLLRVYMKRAGKEPDMQEPLIMKNGSTVMGVAEKILLGRAKSFKYARIWGPSAKFPEQKVGLAHKLKDKDIVELHA